MLCLLIKQDRAVKRVWIIHAPENSRSGAGMSKAGLLPVGQHSFRSDGGVGLAGAVTRLGDLPLIVLSRGLAPDRDWQAMQTELLYLSSHSQQMFADKSGHNVQLDQPDAAVAAIVKMVGQLR